jgi:hypothetical protein
MASIIQLKCQCNNYPWGKKGKDSLAAQYAAVVPGTDFKIDETKEYAEMWMGTYPTTPSLILLTGEDLQQYINAHKEELMGKAVLDKFGADLPYLPKVRSDPIGIVSEVANNTRSFPLPRRYLSKSTQIRTWPRSCTRKSQKSSAIRTTSPR